MKPTRHEIARIRTILESLPPGGLEFVCDCCSVTFAYFETESPEDCIEELLCLVLKEWVAVGEIEHAARESA